MSHPSPPPSAILRNRLAATLLTIALFGVPIVSAIAPAWANGTVPVPIPYETPVPVPTSELVPLPMPTPYEYSTPLLPLPRPALPTPNLDDYADEPFVVKTDDGVIVGIVLPDNTFLGDKFDKDGNFGFSGGVVDHVGFYFPNAHPDKPQVTLGGTIGPVTVDGFVDTDISYWKVGGEVPVGPDITLGGDIDSKGNKKVHLDGSF